MTPYELYLQKDTMEKEAFLGMALRTVANVASSPGLGELAGNLTKWTGSKLGGGVGQKLQQGGQWLYNKSNRVNGAVSNFLNNKGPVIHRYDLSTKPDWVKKPLGFIGMNTSGPQNLTVQRAALWGGNALLAKDTIDSFRPQPPQPLKMASQQVEEDFSALIRYLEGR